MSRTTELVIGAAAGAATAALLFKAAPQRTAALAAPGLAGMTAIYPLMRRSAGPGLGREIASVAVGSVVAAAGTKLSGRTGRVLVALGWAAHGGFDLLHDRGPGSRLPDWYPAMCAGYDFAFGTALAAAALGPPRADRSVRV